MSNYDFTNIGYNSNNYYARDTRVYLIKGSQTASTNAWTGALPDGVSDYFDGLTVDYFLPYAGTNTAATLNLGNKGAKPVYVGGTTEVKTHFPQYAVIRLTYVVNSNLNNGNGCWQAVGSIIDTDTNDKVTQTATTSSENYEVLFSETADNTTRTEGARKTSTLTYNPSTKALSTGGTVDGFVLNNACEKGVTDNSSTTPVTSSDTNLITGRTLYYAGYAKGSGTSGNIAKWGNDSLTDGPAFGNDTTKFLRNDGTWATPATGATNWLNGSQTGSVRTSGSTAEDSSYTIGQYAVAEGENTEASGNHSHAEGYQTRAIGGSSHAEGYETTASGHYSHAEGYSTTASSMYSHAEGYSTTASGYNSHAEGSHTTADGMYSHAGGNYTIVRRKSQTAIGEFNIIDTTGADGTVRGSYAFIIGNGTTGSARSNAFTVDWSGNVRIALDSTQTTGTDYELYQAINSLGWTSDVIE